MKGIFIYLLIFFLLQIDKMTQVKKATKTKAISGRNFIKLDSSNATPEVEESESNEQTQKPKTIISGSKEAVKSRGVVYVSHIPHGFYENQMRKYFEQVRIVRNSGKTYLTTHGIKLVPPKVGRPAPTLFTGIYRLCIYIITFNIVRKHYKHKARKKRKNW